VPILFLLGRFHFDHLYKGHVTLCDLCMIAKTMNKRMFTICKCNCHSFTLYLCYAKLTPYSTGLIQTSKDAMLNMTDDAHKDDRGIAS
jgi:hypothetical protein